MNPSTFEELKKFIADKRKMQTSHIYKPVMIQTVLRNGGAASREEIAKAILSRDTSQIEYYRREVVHKMPGVRLVRDGILSRDGETYRLTDAFRGLTEGQRLELEAACEKRIEDIYETRSVDPYAHRGRTRRPISGSLVYEVLKRAGRRCELCGILDRDKPLQIDHIKPKSLGGTNDISNLQALCYWCNAQKGNRDDTDFRQVEANYAHRELGCPFCDNSEYGSRLVAEEPLAVAIKDGYAVTKRHTLVIPRRHVADYFDLNGAEVNTVQRLLNRCRDKIQEKDKSVEGFNVGINSGEVAGQTVFHCHVHLIPRRKGDVENPRGGVRGVIPGKQDY
jgi:ATP adenylyltransferase